MTAARHLAWIAAALCGCGDNLRAMPDATASDQACIATFSGNFAESSTSADCASLVANATKDLLLELSVPSATLAAKLAISIDLGAAPTAGTYTSETVALWSALAQTRIGNGACEYSAGVSAVPPGSFELALAAIDPTADSVHGTLSVTLYVLAYPGTACGPSDTELATVQF